MKTLKINSSKIKVAHAKDEATRASGLMHIRAIPCNHGMLFEYPSEKILNFWMKNTTIPLSIAFIDKEHKIIEIQDMEPMSEKSISSSAPAKWALEMNKGWFSRNNIKIGDKVSNLGGQSVRIKIIKMPPEAKKLAKKIEDALVSMTMKALKTRLGPSPDLKTLHIDVDVE